MRIIPNILKMKMWSRYVKNLVKIHWWNTRITTWIINHKKKNEKLHVFPTWKDLKKIKKNRPQILFYFYYFFPFFLFFSLFFLSFSFLFSSFSFFSSLSAGSLFSLPEWLSTFLLLFSNGPPKFANPFLVLCYGLL